jgi:hypothetical protein
MKQCIGHVLHLDSDIFGPLWLLFKLDAQRLLCRTKVSPISCILTELEELSLYCEAWSVLHPASKLESHTLFTVLNSLFIIYNSTKFLKTIKIPFYLSFIKTCAEKITYLQVVIFLWRCRVFATWQFIVLVIRMLDEHYPDKYIDQGHLTP